MIGLDPASGSATSKFRHQHWLQAYPDRVSSVRNPGLRCFPVRLVSEVAGGVPSTGTSYPKLGGYFMRLSMVVKSSNGRRYVESRDYIFFGVNTDEREFDPIEWIGRVL